MGRTDDVVRQVCKLNNIIPGVEWIQMPPGFRDTFSFTVTLKTGCRELNPATVNVGVIALISENSTDTHVMIYTDG